MKTEANEKPKGKKKVILKAKTHAFYCTVDISPVKKGSFKKGKILLIDTNDTKELSGKKLYKVSGLSHDNIYIHCGKKNCETLKKKHILSLAKNYLKKKDSEKDITLKLTLPDAASIIQRKIDIKLNDEENPVNGLCFYEEDAFDNCDGFEYKKKKEIVLEKGGGEELYEKQDLPKKKVRCNYSLRGNGDGIGFIN